MRSNILAAVALSLASLAAVPTLALAAPESAAKAHSARTEKGDKEKAQFPMPAATFKAKIDEKLLRARQHMETRAAKLDAEKAKEVRAKFDAGAAKVNDEVAKATADGTVTREEAKDVYTAMRGLRGAKHAHKTHEHQPKKS